MTELLRDIAAYRDIYPSGHHLHIVLEDGNLEDEWLTFCQLNARAGNDAQGAAIARALLELPFETRERLYDDDWGS